MVVALLSASVIRGSGYFRAKSVQWIPSRFFVNEGTGYRVCSFFRFWMVARILQELTFIDWFRVELGGDSFFFLLKFIVNVHDVNGLFRAMKSYSYRFVARISMVEKFGKGFVVVVLQH